MGFSQTSLSGVRCGFMPPQVKTKQQILTLFLLLNQGGRRRGAQSSTTPATPGAPENATILVESTPNVVHTETVETTPSENIIAGPTE